MNACVKLNEKDTVATVTRTLNQGDMVTYRLDDSDCDAVKVINQVPLYHKVALSDMEKGSPIFKYGHKIGYALVDIKAGEHVHTHNMSSKKED